MYCGVVLEICLDCVCGRSLCRWEGKVALVKGNSISSLSVLSFPHWLSPTLWCTTSYPPCSSLSSSCAPLQPIRLPSKRKRGLASVWSAQGDSVCTQCLPSWANSSAAAVWAKPGALVVTNAPLQEQVRPPATSDIYPFSMRTKDPKLSFLTILEKTSCQTPLNKSADVYTSMHQCSRGIQFCPVGQCPAGLC